MAALVGATLAAPALAQTAGRPPVSPSQPPSVNPTGDKLPLTSTRDLSLNPTQLVFLEKLAEVERLYAEVKHEAAGTLGQTLLAQGAKPNDDQRFKIANSLAWTGRLYEAYAQYELLLNTRYDSEARLALANAERWRGRADKAMPMLSQVLALDPANTGARDSLEYGSRELRPSTTISVGGIKDSSDMGRRYVTVAHRWRDESGTKIYEIETRAMQDKQGTALKVNESDVTLRFQPLELALQPKVYVNLQATPSTGAFGGVRLKLSEGPTHLYLDRLSWGALAVSARSLDAGLTAYHAGLESTQSFALGSLYGRASAYRVSDGNTVLTSSVRFTPAWRPLGQGLKAYVSTETRDVRFNTPNYWSPSQGSGTLGVGLIGEWAEKDWSLYTAGQLGRPLYGESGNSWSASAGGKRWLSKDYALGVNLWGMSSWRDGVNYRARSLSLNLEKLW